MTEPAAKPGELIVVARMKGETPHFTKAQPFSELFESCANGYPIDKVFQVVEDESGYRLREIGVLSLQFIPIGDAPEAPRLAPPPPPPPPTPEPRTIRTLPVRTPPPPPAKFDDEEEEGEGLEQDFTPAFDMDISSMKPIGQVATDEPRVMNVNERIPTGQGGALQFVNIIPATKERADANSFFGKINPD